MSWQSNRSSIIGDVHRGLSKVRALLTTICSAFWLSLLMTADAFAADAYFRDAHIAIVRDLAGSSFGAMTLAVACLLALVSAATGSFRAVWAVLFVALGMFTLESIVGILFPVRVGG